MLAGCVVPNPHNPIRPEDHSLCKLSQLLWDDETVSLQIGYEGTAGRHEQDPR